MPPPSPPPERAKVADFYAARSEPTPPLPWQTFAPPFPAREVEDWETRAAEVPMPMQLRMAEMVRDDWWR